ncbi:hypothetical protein [Deinococcus aquiradiocola]|uniref:Uncharacterized protein n=1 Tax=Deinococcus aquiradiocola TaxID=393059 RepID=A0A917UMP6_9DEIO|nr:hypothetical protein [Deinococcus aquiradiocola]GGJ68480.1 hypothetical protein GCM10008939_11150 [Deinococcus aquiradiocola]
MNQPKRLAVIVMASASALVGLGRAAASGASLQLGAPTQIEGGPSAEYDWHSVEKAVNVTAKAAAVIKVVQVTRDVVWLTALDLSSSSSSSGGVHRVRNRAAEARAAFD